MLFVSSRCQNWSTHLFTVWCCQHILSGRRMRVSTVMLSVLLAATVVNAAPGNPWDFVKGAVQGTGDMIRAYK